jgi:hypothetical protein
MVIDDPEWFFSRFPRLNKTNFKVTSPENIRYNCIAWAMGENNRWWWPNMFWPDGNPREAKIWAFEKTFISLGFEPCKDGKLKKGYEKIALYAIGDEPTHMARQLITGKWTSKLGPYLDIEHEVKDLEGPQYGKVVMFFYRQSQKNGK